MPNQPSAISKSAAEAEYFPITDGWRTGTKLHDPGIAHFYLNGYSVCHRWITTRLDRPSKPGDQRCPECKERHA